MKRLALFLCLLENFAHAAAVAPSLDSAWVSVAGANLQQVVTLSFTVNSGANRVLWVHTGSTSVSNFAQVTSATFNGTPMTMLSRTQTAGGVIDVSNDLWYLVNPSNTTANIIVTWNGTIAYGNFSAAEYKNEDQTTIFGTNAAKTAGAGPSVASVAATITTSYTNAVVISGTGCYSCGLATSTVTVDGALVKRVESYTAPSGGNDVVAADSNGAVSTGSHTYTTTFGTPANVNVGTQLLVELIPVQPLANGQRSPFYWNRQRPLKGPMLAPGLR